MNIQLFTNDDIRENVLKHIRGGSIMFMPPGLQSETDERSNTYPSGSLSRGNIPACRASHLGDSSDLPPKTHSFYSLRQKSLSPSQTPYVHLTAECYAEQLVDELNWRTNK